MAEPTFRDVLSLRDHFLQKGERPRFDGQLLSLPATVEGRDIPCDVLWAARPGLVQFLAMAPLVVPSDRKDAMALTLSELNSTSALPGFQLREVGGRWRVFYLATAFQAEDQSISATAAEKCLLACRNSIARAMTQLEAALT